MRETAPAAVKIKRYDSKGELLTDDEKGQQSVPNRQSFFPSPLHHLHSFASDASNTPADMALAAIRQQQQQQQQNQQQNQQKEEESTSSSSPQLQTHQPSGDTTLVARQSLNDPTATISQDETTFGRMIAQRALKTINQSTIQRLSMLDESSGQRSLQAERDAARTSLVLPPPSPMDRTITNDIVDLDAMLTQLNQTADEFSTSLAQHVKPAKPAPPKMAKPSALRSASPLRETAAKENSADASPKPVKPPANHSEWHILSNKQEESKIDDAATVTASLQQTNFTTSTTVATPFFQPIPEPGSPFAVDGSESSALMNSPLISSTAAPTSAAAGPPPPPPPPPPPAPLAVPLFSGSEGLSSPSSGQRAKINAGGESARDAMLRSIKGGGVSLSPFFSLLN